MDDMTNPTGAEDASGGGAVMDRAVRAARDLLATLTESGEGVSLVTILTKAVLENRAARERADGRQTGEDAAERPADDPTPEPAVADAGTDPEPDTADDGDASMEGAPDFTADDDASGTRTVPDGNGIPDGDAVDDASDGDADADAVTGDARVDPETEERYDAQMGARVAQAETFYPNLPAFVECFLANVFPFHQSASSHIQWVPDWWRHPALVFPLDAIWRSYETARRSPGQMMIWYIQASSMLDRVFDKDRGIVASTDAETITTVKGAPLPCERPPRGWRGPIVDRLSVPGPGRPADTDRKGKEGR